MYNQSLKFDGDKLPMMLMLPSINEAIVRVRLHGIEKYGDKNNWKSVENERWENALIRHILAYIVDPDGIDPDSGLMHIEHIACNVAYILENIKSQK